ncbi:MAG: acetate kinase, partial [Oscillospiraceae bacterium]|nr:acetate kinase [Oscillospiraceae bacterium]
MKILVINAGSSSLKYQLIDMDNEQMVCKGNCERIGDAGSFIGHKTADGREMKKEVVMPDHTAAFLQVKEALLDKEVGVISDLSEVSAIGHRIVQGGAIFSESVLVDEKVIEGIESLIPLAPLHNKGHVQAIRGCFQVFGDSTPEVVVFDTAFHSTMPPKAFMYAVPYEYYEKYQVRRYGFHGTSHRYVSGEMAVKLGRDIKDLKLITCHIGNGSSITAIDGGKVIDTSMGLTPLDGFMMGTRSGTLDPSVVTFIAEKEGITPQEMSQLLNKKSGLLGISGVSSDDRDVSAAELAGNERAHLAHEMLYYQIAKYIG